MRRPIVFVLSTIIVFGMSIPAFAESLPSYDGYKTATWAKNNVVRNGNKNWTSDCTKFARLCLEAGGVPRDKAKEQGYEPDELGNYLVDNGYADRIDDLVMEQYQRYGSGECVLRLPEKGNEGKLSPGDLIVSVCQNPKCGDGCHSFILTEIKDGYWWRCQHISNGNVAAFKEYGIAQSARCYRCDLNDPSKIRFVAYHIKSRQNGYSPYAAVATGVKVRCTGYNKLTVSWKKCASANAGYNVFYHNKDVKYFRLLGHVGTSKMKYTYKVPKERYGQEIQFFVRPCRKSDVGGKMPDVGKKSIVVKGHTVPDLPKNVIGKRLSAKKVKVTWKKGNGMKGCMLEYRYAGTKKWTLIKKEYNTTSYTRSVKKGKTVQFRLTPYSKGKGKPMYSDKAVTVKIR